MGKSSSSVKKKRSKNSSQARIMKRSKSRTRRNYKSKKLRHRDDSVSYSSDSFHSRSSESVSSSSSEDDYRRRRRTRSRTRKDVKVSKKRARQWSYSSESTEDFSRVKKKKGSKRDDFQVCKRSREKRSKKSKRDVSVSSTSSGSFSCSTCRGGISSSYESEVEKNRGRSEKKHREKRILKKVKNENKRRRSRSRSCSSCSQYSNYRSEDKLTGEAHLRRLRSVITIVRDGKEEEVISNDEHKEEMIYDHDDYPSSRSNDSNDGSSKRDIVNNSHVAYEEKKNAEDRKGEAVVSYIRNCKVMGSDKDSDGHEMIDDVKAKENGDCGAVDSLSYNLESVLRQKALENLRMFRRGNQMEKVPVTQKDVIGSEVNAPSSTKSELSQNRSLQAGGDREKGASQVAETDSIPTNLSRNDEKIFDRNDSGKTSGSAKHDIEHSAGRLACAVNPSERVSITVSAEANEPRSVTIASRQRSINISTRKQVPAMPEPLQANSMTGNEVMKDVVGPAQSANFLNGNSNHEKTNNNLAFDDPSSCMKSLTGGTSSNNPQDEANESSQFQQKTMSVMRGGEMVEVSYKVYIPKKAPALARRPLKR